MNYYFCDFSVFYYAFVFIISKLSIKGEYLSMKKIISILIIIIFSGFMFCKEEVKQNRVDIDQIDNDNSNDYKYIFKEEIEKEKRLKRKPNSDEFK